MYRLITNEKAKEFIQTYRHDVILGFFFDMSKGKQLHKDRYSKEKACTAAESAKTVILNDDNDFSIVSLYSTLQDERKIKAEGTKLDLIIIEADENLFEKYSEKP